MPVVIKLHPNWFAHFYHLPTRGSACSQHLWLGSSDPTSVRRCDSWAGIRLAKNHSAPGLGSTSASLGVIPACCTLLSTQPPLLPAPCHWMVTQRGQVAHQSTALAIPVFCFALWSSPQVQVEETKDHVVLNPTQPWLSVDLCNFSPFPGWSTGMGK